MYSSNQIIVKVATVSFIVLIYFFSINPAIAAPYQLSRAYYITTSGNDNNTGRKNNPFKTIEKINSITLHPGDSVLLQGGQTFSGTLKIHRYESGLAKRLIIIGSSDKKPATINGGNYGGLVIDSARYIQVRNLQLKGSGRKQGNTRDGIWLNKCSNILLTNLAITGFQKAGLLVYSSSEIVITQVHAYENGFAGISVDGEYGKKDTKQIYLADCLAENNPGDPSNHNNHSGNGIIVGNCSNVIIKYCVATNNGWDMPRVGNGPVGIWCYEADNVKIQYCISYGNKTAKGADDGGGFDLDGGVTNSVIEHCLAYNNQGSAFGIFQYAGAGPWHDNIIRNNISENNGTVSAAHAEVYIWNSSGDPDQFKNLSFYNNVVYNAKGAAIHYARGQDKRNGFNFYDNFFVGKDEIISGSVAGDIFNANTWWSLADGFNADSTRDFETWVLKTGKEKKDGKITGRNINPEFKNTGKTTLTDPHQLAFFFSGYQRVKK